MGKFDPEAPRLARERYRLEIIDVDYDEFSRRMASARSDLPGSPRRKHGPTATSRFLARRW